ncbi:MAG: zinc ribbon domain-containing protein [Pseudomonadota bacterium]
MYAGFVEAACWGVSRRVGRHEGLIDAATFNRIQDRLNGAVRAPARKDLGTRFALRGFVECADCGNPLYSCVSRGRLGKGYPYYLCQTKGCPSYGKSIRRDKLEGDFEALLRQMRPTKALLTLVRDMFLNAWELRRAQVSEMQRTAGAKLAGLERQIDNFLDRIADAASPTAVTAYERRIEKLDAERLQLQSQLENGFKPTGTIEECLEPALQFFASPWKVWASGRPELRRLVLRLAFSERLAYCRKTGTRTPKTTLPFNMLEGFQAREVCDGGPSLTDLEPLLEVLEDWSEQLKGVDLSEFCPPVVDVSSDLDTKPTDGDLSDAQMARSPSEPGGPS